MSRVILDTGPLVALFNHRDAYHLWALEQIKQIEPPLITCESVIVEASFLMAKMGTIQPQQLFHYLDTGALEIKFSLSDEYRSIRILLEKYASVPMSVAGACLVRMSEIWGHAHVFTLDSDFRIYRKNRNEIIPCIIPEQR
jgi:predicted nucleic acid-binding protein